MAFELGHLVSLSTSFCNILFGPSLKQNITILKCMSRRPLFVIDFSNWKSALVFDVRKRRKE